MGLLSKILMGLNLVAALAFIYLGTTVWSKRQEWTYSVFRHTEALIGLPLGSPLDSPLDGDAGTGDIVPFDFPVNDGLRLTEIRKSTLQKIVPAGGNEFGGDAVASQTAEIKRVQQKVMSFVDAADGAAAKRALLLKYLNNLARTGAHRDGAFALLRDIFNPNRRDSARREIGLLARTPTQTDTLKTLAAIGDKTGTQSARQAVLDLLKTTAPLGISGDTKEARDEAERNLRNALADIDAAAKTDAVDRNALAAGKKKLLDLVSSEAVKGTLSTIVDLLQVALDEPAQADNARKALRDIVLSSARSDSEKAALNALADILMDGKSDANERAIAAGKAVLQQYFDDAAAPATVSRETSGGSVNESSDKARQIAHILYHLDADKRDFRDRWDWQQRVIAIVGLNRYVETANSQAIALGEMAQRRRGSIRQEELVFRADYLGQMQTALELADRLSGLNAEQSILENQKSNAQVNVNNRTKERENLERNLDDNKASAKRFLADLAAREKEIFSLLQEMNSHKQDLLDLESKVRERERKIK